MKKLIKNRKGDLVIDSLMILLLLILFFVLVDPLQITVNEVSAFSNDNIVLWMLRAFPFLILLGVLRYVSFKARGEI